MKTVVVTGGTRGIGRAVSEKFLQNGYNVCIIYKSSDKLAIELDEKYQKLSIYKCDIANSFQVKETCEKILNEHKNIDILVNNAGISAYSLFTDTTDDNFEEIFDINVKGTYSVTRNLIKNMINNKSGVIINISSMWGQVGASLEVLYSSTKGAINAFTKALAKEVGLSGIRVNCVCPGVIKTDMLDDVDQQTIDYLKEETPLNRIGTPEDIANTVYFLGSDQASFITGQIISVNGGYVI